MLTESISRKKYISELARKAEERQWTETGAEEYLLITQQ